MALIVVAGWVPHEFVREMEAAGDRAVDAGASEPLTFVGMGATGIVFCGDEGHAWKVGRHRHCAPLVDALRDEFEFMRDACKIGEIRRSIACPFAWHEAQATIERECPSTREDDGRKDWRGIGHRRSWETWARIRSFMEPFGWYGVEYKHDSFIVVPGRGPVLVDASSAIRVGWGMVKYVQAILSGKRPMPGDTRPRDLAWAMRADARQGRVPQAVADKWTLKLQHAFPQADWEM